MSPIQDFRLNDVVKLKKPHPCGANRWLITRLGADIKLQCQGCGHYVMLTRRETETRFKLFLGRGTVDACKPADEKQK